MKREIEEEVLKEACCKNCGVISTIHWDQKQKVFVCGNCGKPNKFSLMVSPHKVIEHIKNQGR